MKQNSQLCVDVHVMYRITLDLISQQLNKNDIILSLFNPRWNRILDPRHLPNQHDETFYQSEFLSFKGVCSFHGPETMQNGV